MDRVATGRLRDREQLFHVEVRAGALACQRMRLVGSVGVRRARVILGEDRRGGQRQLLGGPDDAYRDLAAVRD